MDPFGYVTSSSQITWTRIIWDEFVWLILVSNQVKIATLLDACHIHGFSVGWMRGTLICDESLSRTKAMWPYSDFQLHKQLWLLDCIMNGLTRLNTLSCVIRVGGALHSDFLVGVNMTWVQDLGLSLILPWDFWPAHYIK